MTATWTEPNKSWLAGELVLATVMNQYVRDQLDFLKTPASSGNITFAADVTLTSTSYADVAGMTTGAMTTYGGGLDVFIRLTINQSSASNTDFQLMLDGVSVAILGRLLPPGIGSGILITFFHHIPAVAAGSHTIKLQAKSSAGTITFKGTTSALGDPLLYVVEGGA